MLCASIIIIKTSTKSNPLFINVFNDTVLEFVIFVQDMNEPANFGTNEERPFNWPETAKPYWSLKCPKNNLDDPPYRTSSDPFII